jgi:hypothetical protein
MNDMNHMYNLPDRADPVHEWELERDEALFTAHGYWCEIKRHPDLGTLNGYVYMGAHHPYANDDCPNVSVHGGITYNDGKKMGFDCSHAGDLVPYHIRFSTRVGITPYDETYRNWAYVKEQVENLAAQLRAVDPITDVQMKEVPDGILPAM